MFAVPVTVRPSEIGVERIKDRSFFGHRHLNAGMKLIVIDAKYFYAGVELNDDRHVCRCAPIVNFLKGWSARRVLRYAANRK